MNRQIKFETGDIAAEPQYARKTDAEICQLARGIISGAIFGSWSICESDLHLLPCIFMPLSMFNDIHRKILARDGVVHFYGEIVNSVQRSINGLPMFFDMYFLNQEDTDRLLAVVDGFANSEKTQ